jgi:hypothetical protein
MYTIFCDIDGCIFKNLGSVSAIIKIGPTPGQDYLLPGALEAFNKWYHKGCNIILTTGRPSSMRALTKNQLSYFGLFYDQLVMDLNNHPRVLVNDDRQGVPVTASAITLPRNEGIPNPSFDQRLEL